MLGVTIIMVREDETIIVSNQVRCNLCGDEPFSAHRHDYKKCKCGSVGVDGGMNYLRRTFNDDSDFTDLSIIMTKECVEDCVKALTWAEETDRNKYGKVFAIMRALRDNGYNMNIEGG